MFLELDNIWIYLGLNYQAKCFHPKSVNCSFDCDSILLRNTDIKKLIVEPRQAQYLKSTLHKQTNHEPQEIMNNLLSAWIECINKRFTEVNHHINNLLFFSHFSNIRKKQKAVDSK